MAICFLIVEVMAWNFIWMWVVPDTSPTDELSIFCSSFSSSTLPVKSGVLQNFGDWKHLKPKASSLSLLFGYQMNTYGVIRYLPSDLSCQKSVWLSESFGPSWAFYGRRFTWICSGCSDGGSRCRCCWRWTNCFGLAHFLDFVWVAYLLEQAEPTVGLGGYAGRRHIKQLKSVNYGVSIFFPTPKYSI